MNALTLNSDREAMLRRVIKWRAVQAKRPVNQPVVPTPVKLGPGEIAHRFRPLNSYLVDLQFAHAMRKLSLADSPGWQKEQDR